MSIIKWLKYGNNPILTPRTQSWEGGNDIIFPCVISVKDVIPNALDSFYMYFAPHDSPGGIGLATAPHPLGPWRKYGDNPVIARRGCKPFAHVSSPHVLAVPEQRLFYMYYHGLGEWDIQKASQTTGMAISSDGIHWEKQDEPCIDRTQDNTWDDNEISYARVTRLDDKWLMTFMGRDKNRGAPALGLALSEDGIHWEKQSTPLIAPGVDTQACISSGQLVEFQGKLFLFYVDETNKATNSTIWCKISYDGGDKWSQSTTVLRPGKFWQWDRIRVHDPYILESEGKLYIYYAGGARRHSNGIGVAVGTLGETYAESIMVKQGGGTTLR